MLVVPIPERKFNLYALALPEGLNFEPYVVVSGWKCDNAVSVGGVLLNHDNRDFGFTAFRRQIDHRFVVTSTKFGFKSSETALVPNFKTSNFDSRLFWVSRGMAAAWRKLLNRLS
jgi:hypothetical protein